MTLPIGPYMNAVPSQLNIRKTKKWDVIATSGNGTLGWVQFRPQWRKFVFVPKECTVFDAECLVSIADFCNRQTKVWRDGLTKKKAV